MFLGSSTSFNFLLPLPVPRTPSSVAWNYHNFFFNLSPVSSLHASPELIAEKISWLFGTCKLKPKILLQTWLQIYFHPLPPCIQNESSQYLSFWALAHGIRYSGVTFPPLFIRQLTHLFISSSNITLSVKLSHIPIVKLLLYNLNHNLIILHLSGSLLNAWNRYLILEFICWPANPES